MSIKVIKDTHIQKNVISQRWRGPCATHSLNTIISCLATPDDKKKYVCSLSPSFFVLTIAKGKQSKPSWKGKFQEFRI